MLERDVEVFDELRLRREHVDQLFADGFRVEVVNADPVEAIDLTKLAQQLRQLPRTVEVFAIAAGVLRDDDQFLHAVLGERLGLGDQLLHLPAAVMAAQLRNDAERAIVVTALGDLEIGILLRRRQDAARLVQRGADVVEALIFLPVQDLLRRVDNVVIRARAEHTVDLRHLVHDLLLIALGQTAGDENLPDTALLFERAHGQNVVDGLFLGRIDETAGVDDHQLHPIGVRQNFISGLPQQIEHLLGVDLIFGTTERDHADRMRHSSSSVIVSSSSRSSRSAS